MIQFRRAVDLKDGPPPACRPKPFSGRRPEGFGPQGGGLRYSANFCTMG
jgi:hypothetical protein